MAYEKIRPPRWRCECVVCAYRWVTRTEQKPRHCTHCGSTHWNDSRRKRRTRSDKGLSKPATAR